MRKGIGEKRGRAGMTLVEAVVALALLGVVALGAYRLIVVGLQLNRMARLHHQAIVLANSRLERARNFRYEDLGLIVENATLLNAAGTTDEEGAFRRSTAVNTNYAAGLSRVQVTVEIRDPRTGSFAGETETVSTLMTKYLEP